MCPECVASVPAVVAGVTFTGGFIAFVVKAFRLARRPWGIFDETKGKEKESCQTSLRKDRKLYHMPIGSWLEKRCLPKRKSSPSFAMSSARAGATFHGRGDEEVRVRWPQWSRDPGPALRAAFAARRIPRDVRSEDRDTQDAVH